MNVLREKIKEVLFSVLPIILIVVISGLAFVSLSGIEMIRFFIGAALIVVGLALFLVGVEIGITPIGRFLGTMLTRSGRLWKLALFSVILSFLVSIAEPDLHILAGQVENLSGGVITRFFLVLVVSVGIGVLFSVGMIRIVRNIPIHILMIILYTVVLIVALFAKPEFLSIAFDASGATTGALAVPVILALSLGASAIKKDRKASEKDSFGLVGISSVGPILAVLIISVIISPEQTAISAIDTTLAERSILSPFFTTLPSVALETFMSLFPITVIFFFLSRTGKDITRRVRRRAVKGVLYSYIGLTFFLTGVHAGFMDVGAKIGRASASGNSYLPLFVIAFILGFVTVLAEPAVHVLTSDIEQVTGGYVRRKAVFIALSIGVAVAVLLSAVRIVVPSVQLWHFLLPGYVISLALTLFVPKMFVGMAFDAGGVASGPMTATFILAFTAGAAGVVEGANPLADGFGMIAMVAMMPIITIQILGALFKIKSRKGGIENAR